MTDFLKMLTCTIVQVLCITSSKLFTILLIFMSTKQPHTHAVRNVMFFCLFTYAFKIYIEINGQPKTQGQVKVDMGK